MFRFSMGLGFGVILTIYAFAFVGVGHGTYAPLAFTTPLIALGAIPTLVLGSFLWAVYFLLVPQIRIVKRPLHSIEEIDQSFLDGRQNK